MWPCTTNAVRGPRTESKCERAPTNTITHSRETSFFFLSLFLSWLEHPSYFHLFHSQLILICAFAVWHSCAPRLLLNISLYYFSRGPPKHKPPPPMKSGSSTEMVSGHFFHQSPLNAHIKHSLSTQHIELSSLHNVEITYSSPGYARQLNQSW